MEPTEKPKEERKPIQLTHGCISLDDRLTSRDSAQPEYFDSREDAQRSLDAHSRFYRSIGYKVWFSNIQEWNGTEYK